MAAAWLVCRGFYGPPVDRVGTKPYRRQVCDEKCCLAASAVVATSFALGPAAVAKEGTGNLVTMALDGIPEAENYIELILNKILNMSIIPWILVAYIWYENWLTGFTLLIMFPIIILFMVILGLAARDKSESQYAGFQKMSNHFIDSLRGLKTLQLMGISREYANNVYEVSEDYRKQTMGVLRIAMLSTFALDFSPLYQSQSWRFFWALS